MAYVAAIFPPLLLLSFVISASAAKQKLLVKMQTIDYTLNLFQGCDIFLLSETVELENFHQIRHPVSLYTKFRTFNRHFKSHPFLSVATRSRELQARTTLLKARNCKAQIVALVPEERPNIYHFGSTESVEKYMMLIHLVPRPIDTSWVPLTKLSYKLLAGVFKAWRRRRNHDIRYLYHTISSLTTPSPLNSGKINPEVPLYSVNSLFLLSVCALCTDGFDDPRLMRFVDMDDVESKAPIVKDHRPHYQNSLHHEVLKHEYTYSTVSAHFQFEERYMYFLRGHKSWNNITLLNPRQIISERISHPHFLLVWDLKTRFSNMSVGIYCGGRRRTIGENHKDFEKQTLVQSFNVNYNHEVIFSPNYAAHPTMFTQVICTKEVALTFVTTGNVTMSGRTGIFAAPLDHATWVLTLMSTVIVTLVLVATSKVEGNLLLRLLNAFVMMWRILVENFNDESASTTANKRTFAILTTTLAMIGVVLTNGYKGVLTSDLAFAPTFSGPEEVKQILGANWSIGPFSYSIQYEKTIRPSFDGVPRVPSSTLPIFSHVAKMFGDLSEQREDSYNLMSKADPFNLGFPTNDFKKLLKRLLQQGPKERADMYERCNLTRAAFWTFKPKSAPLTELYLPRACLRVLRYKPFVVGRQSFVPGRLAWGVATYFHDGKFFSSIKNLVETGVHSRLEKLTGDSKVNLKVVDYTVEPIEPMEPMAFSMDNPLISSIFFLWWRLLLAAMICAILEVAIGTCRLLFSFEM